MQISKAEYDKMRARIRQLEQTCLILDQLCKVRSGKVKTLSYAAQVRQRVRDAYSRQVLK